MSFLIWKQWHFNCYRIDAVRVLQATQQQAKQKKGWSFKDQPFLSMKSIL